MHPSLLWFFCAVARGDFLSDCFAAKPAECTMGVGEAIQSVSISHRIALVCYPFMLRFVPVAILKVNGCTC